MKLARWTPMAGIHQLSGRRLEETQVGCPLCGSTAPTHVQIRAMAPAHVWRCSCGVHWAVKDGRSLKFDETLPWSQQHA